MTDLERARERMRIIDDAIEFTKDCANQDRKAAHERNMDGHYVKALQELTMCRGRIENLLRRAEAGDR